MSKCKNAILNAMAGGEWMSSTQIAKICGFPKETVKASLNNMQRTGLVVKKDDPDHRPCRHAGMRSTIFSMRACFYFTN